MTDMKNSLDRLIETGMQIDSTEAGASDMQWTARGLVLASLPVRAVAGHHFVRSAGNFKLTLMSATKIPYGVLPRLILLHLCSEAKRTRQREIDLGDSISGFMRELGMSSTGGVNGTHRRLKEQMGRLFNSTVNARWESSEGATSIINQSVVNSAQLWFEKNDWGGAQKSLFTSNVVLSESLFKEIMNFGFPVHTKALAALSNNSIAIDLYCWSTFRVSGLKGELRISWPALQLQFGCGPGERLRDFKKSFVLALNKVSLVFTQLRFEIDEKGLTLRPSLTAIRSVKGS